MKKNANSVHSVATLGTGGTTKSIKTSNNSNKDTKEVKVKMSSQKLTQNEKLHNASVSSTKQQVNRKPISNANANGSNGSNGSNGAKLGRVSTSNYDRSVQKPQKSENTTLAVAAGAAGAAKSQNMSTKRYEIIFNNYLVHLLNKLHELEELGYSEVKDNLDHCFLKYSKLVDNGRIQEYLQHVHERFQSHIKLIAEQDDFLFSTDYNQGDLRLISGLDLYSIWQSLDTLEHSLEVEDITLAEKALNLKKTIWQSLTNLYVSSCLALGRTDDSWAISIMKNLRLAKKLEKEIEAEPEEDEGAAAGGFGLPNIADFEKIFNGDNPLSQIINDVRNEINPEEYMRALNPENKPPLEVIMGLFSGQNKEALQSVATSLGMKFEDKMKQRGLTEADLKNAADGMKKDLSKIPGIGMLLSQFDTDAAKATQSEPSTHNFLSASDQNTSNQNNELFQMGEPRPEHSEMLQNAFKDIHEKMQNSQNPQEDAIPMINSLFASLTTNMKLPQQISEEHIDQQVHEQVLGQVENQEQVQIMGSNHTPSDLPPDPITQMLETMKKMQMSEMS